MSDFLISNVRNSVGLYCSTWERVSPHTYSTIVFTELWKQKDKLDKAKDIRKFSKLVQIVKSARANSRNIEEAIQAIYSRHIAPLPLHILKELIGDSPVCKFPESEAEGMTFVLKSTRPPVLSHDYLSMKELISIPVDTIPAEPVAIQVAAPALQETPARSTLIQTKRELEQVYDKLVETRGSSFEKPTYIWQWAFTIDEYSEITKAASECNNLTTNEEKEALLRYDKCVFIIVAYVAERYKREWNGNDNTDNALIQIGYDGSQFSKEIARKYFKDRSDIMIFRHDNEAGTHEYLESLRMEGGLPVKRINGDTALADFAENLYNDRERAIYILCERINNECLKYSYKEKLSIYHYTMQLLQADGIRAIYGSDVDIVPDIRNYADKLAIGRTEAEGQKTRLIYQAWYDAESNSPISLTPILHMYPEDNGERHYAISPLRLSSWGIDNVDSVNSFTLDFVDADERPIKIYDENCSEMDSIYFSKCYNGDFVEFNARKRFIFPTITEEKLSLENIFLSDCSCRLKADTSSTFESIKIIPKRKASQDYIQLYSNDNKFWVSNKGRDPYKYSALIVKVSKKCHPTNDNYENLSNGLVWIPFTTHAELCINGKNKIIYNAQGKIYAFPQGECIHPICRSPYAKNIDSGQVEFYRNSQTGPVSIYLVKPSDIRFDIYREDRRTKEDVKVNSKPQITYRKMSESDWKDYNPDLELQAGYVEFNVTVDNRYSTVVRCFVLPSDCTLDIDLQKKRVLFKNIACVVKHGESRLNLVNGTTYTHISKKDGVNKLEGTDGLLTFSVHCDEGYFHVMTLHPVEGTFYMLNDGKILSSKQNGLRTTPLAFIGRIKRIKLDASGGNIEHIGHTSPDAYKYVMEQQLNCTLPTSENGKEVGGCRYVAYSGSFEKVENRRIYRVPGNAEPQKGCFYFLSLGPNEIFEITPGEDRSLNLESIKEEGILFQSLKGRTSMDVYIRPMYVPHIDSTSARPRTEEKKATKAKRVEDFVKNDAFLTDSAFSCFNIAAEHGLYFSTFDILLSLIAEYKADEIPTRICNFLAGYEEYCKKTNTQPNYTALWRLSTEFIFDWLFISKADYVAAGVSDETRNGLYESRPHHRIDDLGEYNTFIEWINSDSDECLRGNSVKNSLLRKQYSIFNTPKDIQSIAHRCKFLNKAYGQSFNKINNKRKLD